MILKNLKEGIRKMNEEMKAPENVENLENDKNNENTENIENLNIEDDKKIIDLLNDKILNYQNRLSTLHHELNKILSAKEEYNTSVKSVIDLLKNKF